MCAERRIVFGPIVVTSSLDPTAKLRYAFLVHNVRTKVSWILTVTAKKTCVVVAVKDLISLSNLRRFQRSFFQDKNITCPWLSYALSVGCRGLHQTCAVAAGRSLKYS